MCCRQLLDTKFCRLGKSGRWDVPRVFNSNAAAGARGNAAEDSVRNLLYQEKAITGWV